MSVVSVSLFSLKRARRALEQAHAEGNWDEVRRWDVELAQYLNDAFDDHGRDTKALIKELQVILGTYSKIVDELPDESMHFIMRSDLGKPLI